MPDKQSPLSIKERLAYGLGDSGANFIFQTQITFLLYFYTDVLGIAAATAGQILLVSRVVDAFNDPIIGALADRTKTRWGRYRPWLLWTAVPLAVALVLCYTTPQFVSTGKIVWAIITYNVLMIIYAANNIPYCALSGVMTSDTHERTSLASWRFLCAMAATLVVNMFTVDLVQYFGRGDQALGYQLTMVLWGALAVACFVIAFAYTKERVSPDPRQRSNLFQDLHDLFHNGPWLALFILGVLIYVQLALRGGSMLYYFTQYLDRVDLFGWFNGLGLAVTMVGVFLAKPLAERLGKRRTFHVCLFLSAVLMAAFALVPRERIAALFALQILMQLSFGPTIPLLWAMMADVADYGEWKTGRRSTALMFASIVFGTKLGLGVGAWLNGRLLEYFGYSAMGEQSESAIRGIVLLVSVLPAAALLIGVGVLFLYRLDDRFVNEIEQDLSERRSETC
jgi:sugar (glycoside-pentoside-hexuronide) transporter